MAELDFTLGAQFRRAPHLNEYFGPWLILESQFRAMADRASKLDLHVHMQSQDVQDAQHRAESDSEDYAVRGNAAVIDVCGSLMKHVSSFSDGTSTLYLRRQIRAASNSDNVTAILLKFDTPGGTVAGTQDAAEEIRKAAAKKPVYAYCEDLCASAGYWLASQCDRIYCNPTAMVGSIGTYMVVYDQSGQYEEAGVKVHVIRAGTFKGSGTPGTEVTEEHLAEYQRITDELNDQFIQGVASGRGLSVKRVREIADGRVHVGESAKELGLVDGVESFDDTLARVQRAKVRPRGVRAAAETEGGIHAAGDVNPDDIQAEESFDRDNGTVLDGDTQMADTKTAAAPVAQVVDTPRAATMKELKAACPGATAEFLVAQLEEECTVAQAKDAWMSHLLEENKSLKSAAKADAEDGDEEEKGKARKSKASSKKAKADDEDGDEDDEDYGKGRKSSVGQPSPLGGKPNQSEASEGSGDVVAEWNTAVEAEKKPGVKNSAAVKAAIAKHPDLHSAYLAEVNRQYQAKQEQAASKR